jgi:hypothetical protein
MPSPSHPRRHLYNRVWIPARDAAGISGHGAFHRLRKTLGTLVHGQADKSDRQLADWLGHGDPSFSARVYTGKLDDGLGKADFLDEVIPVEKWATSGQQNTRRQPQENGRSNGENPLSDAEKANSRK